MLTGSLSTIYRLRLIAASINLCNNFSSPDIGGRWSNTPNSAKLESVLGYVAEQVR